MFFRRKKSGAAEYLQIVRSQRVEGKPRQFVLATLGRVDELERSGELERLLASGARICETAIVLAAHEKGETATVESRRFAAPAIFERLWTETGCRGAVSALARERGFRFDVERAVFLSVLHRLLDPGSDRACENWRDAYAIDGVADLDLHHLYRTMGWLGEADVDQHGATLGPRAIKDLIEEALFAARRDLFNEFSLMILDTTSLYFEGRGGETLGQYGKSKDHRPDLRQVVLAVVIDGNGRPVCSELWPGNTTDVTTLQPVVRRLKHRFAISRVGVIADRGMMAKGTLEALEASNTEYILGTRERSTREVQEVLADPGPFVPLSIPKAAERGIIELEIKEVARGGRRYIVVYNEAEARRDAEKRGEIVRKLMKKLKEGDKALVGNKGFRRYLSQEGDGGFRVDPARIEDDARFDGVYVLRTNTTLSPLNVVLRYRERWGVEDIFRTAKSVLGTRPIFHKCDDTIRGHVFCSFLALVLRKELQDRLDAAGHDLEWARVLGDLDRMVETTVEKDGKRFVLRSAPPGSASAVFQTVGVALPPPVRPAEKPPPISRPRKRVLNTPE